MSINKLINKLKDKYRRNEKLPELREEEVLNIIKSTFEDYEFKKGSHIVVKDSRLKKYWEINPLSEYGRNGQLTVAVKHGQYVARIYIKKILQAIEICELMEEKGEKES